MRTAEFFEPLADLRVRCNLCPHCCIIKPDHTGICRARLNTDGTLLAENYGRVTSLALDPIEKKPLYQFYPGSKILSLGSYGCNFHCGFCQNSSIAMGKAPYQTYTPEEIAAYALELSELGNIGVAYTYNEPLIGYEFVRDCAQLIIRQKQKNVLVTNGFINSEPWLHLLPLISAVNIDLKSLQPAFYKSIGGQLDTVQATIETAVKYCHVEITTLIIPGENDSTAEMKALSTWLAAISPAIPLHISRFFPRHQWLDRSPTPLTTIYRLVEIARVKLQYVYAGNC